MPNKNDSVPAVETVKKTINVFDLIRAGQIEVHLAKTEDKTESPSEIFQVKDGQLHISGAGIGYLATKQNFRDYHLVVEFKWGDHTWGNRVNHARDNGILVHAHGPHGLAVGTWIASFEAQIIEGGMGDIIIINGKLPDGTPVPASLTCEVERDRDHELRWKKGAPRQTLSKPYTRINWEKRDEDWEDVINFHGADDLDAPVGEWNRLEVIARGDTLRYRFNGQIVNEAFDVSPSEGRVCIQTELAETIVRRFELWPLNAFKEPWPLVGE